MDDVKFICPICGREVPKSAYLHGIFADDVYAEWAANLTTHYRHQHIKYYDASWQNWRYRNKNPEYTNHEDFKILINNRAKRQLIRAAWKNLHVQTATLLINGFLKLQHNDSKTLELIKKLTGAVPEQAGCCVMDDSPVAQDYHQKPAKIIQKTLF